MSLPSGTPKVDTPQRRYCRARFERYRDEAAEYRRLTRREYEGRRLPDDWPTDSLQSARVDGMPQSQVAFRSDPTLRLVMRREEIRARLDAHTVRESVRLAWLADRLGDFWDFWLSITDVHRAFIGIRWLERTPGGKPLGPQPVIAWFTAHRDQFPSDATIPENEDAFYALEDTILSMAEHDWLGDAPVPVEPPA